MRSNRLALRSGVWCRSITLLSLVGLVLVPLQTATAQADERCLEEMRNYRFNRGVWQQDTNNVAARDRMEGGRRRLVRCVEEADSMQAESALKLVEADAARLGQIPLMIPEYHDEGRLPTGDGSTALGPMAHIFASPFLGEFTRRAQIFEHGLPGIMAAVVVVKVDGAAGETLPPSYSALGLVDGKNCIWLWATGTRPTDPFEVYVTNPTGAAPCDRSAARTGPYTVYERKENLFKHAQFPGAARFDTDRTFTYPVIAFKCLEAYCEVGASAGTWRRPVTHPGDGNGNPNAPKGVVKGWHDEQFLAERVGNQWRRTSILANIVPAPGAGDEDVTDFEGRWVQVAMVRISGLTAGHKYYDWGLRNGINRVQVRKDGAQWRMRVWPALGSPKTWPDDRTFRMPHHDAVVPATVRFRFTLMDDGIWVPCGNGCCRSDGGT